MNIKKAQQKLQRIQENLKKLEEIETRLTQMGFYKENNEWRNKNSKTWRFKNNY